MSDEVVIRAEGLGKMYLIGHQAERERYVSLRDVLSAKAQGLLKRRAIGEKLAREEFWALRDVDFEIRRGEVVGVVGRNGAGKSTLLKVLSRITEPSRGKVTIKGRVASLLEVGTGFHPELTGRENIYLNGAILGMTRAEIHRKFDEIVAFAEIEKFLDTPVKRYSSGMYVRLAFAVAAHLEPEILVVDEVLAVGDIEFQRKCMGKMQDVASHGRTVLFVSHNMAAVRALCSSAILMQGGRLAGRGQVDEQIDLYMAKSEATASIVSQAPAEADLPFIEEAALAASTCSFGETLNLDLTLVSPRTVRAGIEVEIHDERGGVVAYISTSPMLAEPFVLRGAQPIKLRLSIGPLPLATGRYDLYLWLIQPWVENFHILKQPISFEVVHSDPGGTGFEFRQSYGRGAVTIPMKWTFDELG